MPESNLMHSKLEQFTSQIQNKTRHWVNLLSPLKPSGIIFSSYPNRDYFDQKGMK
jgi:hypothetical protein